MSPFSNIKNVTPTRYAWLFLVAGIVLVYAWVLDPIGLEIQYDSAIYIRGALNIQNGLGYTSAGKLINHYPAGMSWLYAVLGELFNNSIYNIAYWTHLFSLLGIGIIFKQLMRLLTISERIQYLGLILFMFSSPVWNCSFRLLTELHALFFLIVCTLLLFQFIKNPKKDGLLFIIGILFGLSLLLRFAMIGLLGGFLLVLLWQAKTDWRKALKHSFYMCLPVVLIFVAYSTYIRLHYEQESIDRVLLWHPIPMDKVVLYLRTPFTWLFELDYTKRRTLFTLFGSAFLLLLGLSWFVYKNKKKESAFVASNQPIYVAMIIISVIYCLFLALSISLFDWATPLDTRILSPLSIYFYLVNISAFHYLYNQSSLKRVSFAGLLALTIVFNWSATHSFPDRRTTPHMFNHPDWQVVAKAVICDSQEVWLRKDRAIYSNGHYFWRSVDDRYVERIPEIFHYVTNKKNTDIHEDLLSIQQDIANDKAQLVYFYKIRTNINHLPKEKLLSYFSDSSRFEFKDFEKGFIIQGKKINK